MKHTLRCMKNEASLAHEACLRHTKKHWVCFASYEHSEYFIEVARLPLHICEANASFFLAVLFTFCEFYGIITLGSYLLDKLKFDEQRFQNEKDICNYDCCDNMLFYLFL